MEPKKTVKRKPMTAREKKERAETRKYLREKGLLPPVKPRENRRKAAEEASALLDSLDGYGDLLYIKFAIFHLLPGKETKHITDEHMGVGQDYSNCAPEAVSLRETGAAFS